MATEVSCRVTSMAAAVVPQSSLLYPKLAKTSSRTPSLVVKGIRPITTFITTRTAHRIHTSRFISGSLLRRCQSMKPYTISKNRQIRLYLADTPTALPRWHPPADPYNRPVVIVGTGNMGRRIAVMWASTSRPVVLHDHSREALDDALRYVGDTLTSVCAIHGSHPGHVTSTTDLRQACTSNDNSDKSKNRPWMVVEALPELLDLKTRLLGEMDSLVPDDCILATNSSSFTSRELAARVRHRDRLVNTHYYIPPRNIYVEVMPCGDATDKRVAPFLVAQMRDVGLRPIVVPQESRGCVFNRIWAATKRETLKVLAEGVGRPEDVDALFRDFFHAEKGPCERMDEVGLDTIYRIEEHYLNMKGVSSDERKHLEWLERKYIAQGNLGEKSGDGLFTQEERNEHMARRKREKKKIVEEYRGA